MPRNRLPPDGFGRSLKTPYPPVSMKTKPIPTRRGLLAGGNWTLAHLKQVDALPAPQQSALIRQYSSGPGGSPYMLLLALARAGAPFPLAGAGLVGKDAAGADILARCKQRGIETKHLAATPKAPTGFSDVMVDPAGRRMSFHARGANALWDGTDLDFGKLKARRFHLGNLGELDALEVEDRQFDTRSARLLAAAQEAGIKTSVDVARVPAARLTRVVPPALKFTNHLILGEPEAALLTGFKLREPDGRLETVALRHAAGALLQHGVQDMVIIHFPEGAFARTRRGEDAWQSAVKLPPKLVVSRAGAGEAFCAACLLGLHEGWETKKLLEAAVCLAAACLTQPDGVVGLPELAAAIALGKKHRFQPPLEPPEF